MTRKKCVISVSAFAAALALGAFLCRHDDPPPEAVPADTWAAPNLLVNRADLDRISSAVEHADPVLRPAYDDLIRTADALLAQSPEPIAGELRIPGYYTSERETQQRLTRQLRKDARSCHALALAFALTRRPDYGEAARTWLFAWVNALTRPVDGGHWWQFYYLGHRGDTPLVITYSFPAFLYAFDLLHGEYLLSDTEIAAFRDWLRPFVDYCTSEVIYRDNHHSWQVVFLMCAAHVLEDEALFQRAVRYYHRGVRGQIRHDGALFRELRRGAKSGTYTLMALEAMTQAVHIAEQHGNPQLREWRSRRGASLEDAVAFYCDYLDAPQDWARDNGLDEVNAPATPSDWGYFFELPYRWWHDGRYRQYLGKRPYGMNVERCYTLDFATLLFAEPEQ